MATRTIVTCDFHEDGATAAEQVAFALGSKSYKLDLCEEHAAELHTALAPFVKAAGGNARAAGRARKGRGRGRATTSSTRRADLGDIRVWARKQGWEVAERGRIAAEIISSYDQAHGRRRARTRA